MRPLSLRLRLWLMLLGGATILLVLVLSVTMLAVLFDRHVQRVAVSDLRDRALVLLSVIEPGTPPRCATSTATRPGSGRSRVITGRCS